MTSRQGGRERTENEERERADERGNTKETLGQRIKETYKQQNTCSGFPINYRPFLNEK